MVQLKTGNACLLFGKDERNVAQRWNKIREIKIALIVVETLKSFPHVKSTPKATKKLKNHTLFKAEL